MKRLIAAARNLAIAGLVIGGGLIPAMSASASTPGQLDSGATLGSGATLSSPQGNLALTMQTDGNLVLYAPGHRAIWATGTNGHGGAILTEQRDGNLVVIAPGNKAVWASGTSNRPGAVLQVQDDGNLVQYGAGHVAVWSTGTSIGGGNPAPAGGTAAIAALATANIGRTACGTNSLGRTGFYSSCTPEAWCADFAKWVWANTGYKTNYLTPGSISFDTYGRNFGTSHGAGYHPQVGDAIVYGGNSARTSAHHVGIVTGVTGSVIHTANGNFGGGGDPKKSSVTQNDLPANATIGTKPSFLSYSITAIVSPVK